MSNIHYFLIFAFIFLLFMQKKEKPKKSKGEMKAPEKTRTEANKTTLK